MPYPCSSFLDSMFLWWRCKRFGAGDELSWLNRPYLIDPRLAFWVVPALSIALVLPWRHSCLLWARIWAVTIVLAAWVALIRPFPLLFPFLVTWPYTHIARIEEAIFSGKLAYMPPFPFYHSSAYYFWMSSDQTADLVWLLAVLFLCVLSLYKSLPRALLCIITLIATCRSFVEWITLTCQAYGWVKAPPARWSFVLPPEAPHGSTRPRG